MGASGQQGHQGMNGKAGGNTDELIVPLWQLFKLGPLWALSSFAFVEGPLA
ncbi:MAG: hypothetical protein JNM39_04570 [Bdellovibrionaceae bacterium]|nr:hypothetical protein [Pseudobdellovibrionaceae bacterium]